MSPPETLHLPDGRKLTVTPVFGGMGFRTDNHNHLLHPFPVGWMTVLHTEEEVPNFDGYSLNNRTGSPVHGLADLDIGDTDEPQQQQQQQHPQHGPPPRLRRRSRPFSKPTLQSDTLFVSSISMPSSAELKPAASHTREIAMMLWITLYWYFHQPEPPRGLTTPASRDTPESARPRGEWKIRIKRDGVFRGRNLIPKLERMGLIASEDTSVGTSVGGGGGDDGDAWDSMFVSKRMFWQVPANLFLFTLQPVSSIGGSGSGSKSALFGFSPSSGPGSPRTSRPGSPRVDEAGAGGGGGGSSTTTTTTNNNTNNTNTNSTHTAAGPPHLVLDVPGAAVPMSVPSSPGLPLGPYFSSSRLPTYFPPPPLQYTSTRGVRHPLRPKPPRMGEVFYTRFIQSRGQYLSFRVASCSARPVPYLGPVGPSPPPPSPDDDGGERKRSELCGLSDKELLQSWFANPRLSPLCNSVPSPSARLTELWTRVMKHLDACGFSKEKQVSFPHKQAWFVKLRREFWEGPEL
ncbi:aerobactin siderophore biosynthesis protein iucB [Moelleriella libera RCEF 2490]|uniref:Aerobactin siderophore biosynthesis protein iucB n=1 Tax=Moelleriella libera RCEF 2490 TaxID=1081109 RepID=A0A162I2W9_9HYPO|nr:aerobactin siderophore biosynthesis protein iucB [Moelleriella libera RCEF 2490]